MAEKYNRPRLQQKNRAVRARGADPAMTERPTPSCRGPRVRGICGAPRPAERLRLMSLKLALLTALTPRKERQNRRQLRPQN